MQLRSEDLHRIEKVLKYYLRYAVADDVLEERYTDTLRRVECYRENYETED